MKHTDEKGHFAAAQSAIAKRVTTSPSPQHQRAMKAMDDFPTSHTTKVGGRHLAHGSGGLAQLAHMKRQGEHKKREVIARSRMRMHEGLAKGALAAHEHHTAKHQEHRARLKNIARGKSNEYRKSYTKHGRSFHAKGLLKPPA